MIQWRVRWIVGWMIHWRVRWIVWWVNEWRLRWFTPQLSGWMIQRNLRHVLQRTARRTIQRIPPCFIPCLPSHTIHPLLLSLRLPHASSHLPPHRIELLLPPRRDRVPVHVLESTPHRLAPHPLPIRLERHHELRRVAARLPERHATPIPRLLQRIAVIIAVMQTRHHGLTKTVRGLGDRHQRQIEAVGDWLRHGGIWLDGEGDRGLQPMDGDGVLKTTIGRLELRWIIVFSCRRRRRIGIVRRDMIIIMRSRVGQRGIQTLEDRSPVKKERRNVARGDTKHSRARSLKGWSIHCDRKAVIARPRVQGELGLLD